MNPDRDEYANHEDDSEVAEEPTAEEMQNQARSR